jgi:hypothetical protein
MRTNVSEVLEVKSPLPLKGLGPIGRFWIRLQSAGLLKATGLTQQPIRVDAYQILGALHRRPLFRIAMSCNGMTAGASSTVSVSEALQKAFSELCEIFEMSNREHILGQTRSGFAAHENEECARQHAYLELIERDSLITHFLCPQVNATPLSRPYYASLPARLAKLWSADPTICVVMSGLRDRSEGPWFLGAGAAQNLETATEKAYLECVSTYCGYRHADDVTHLISPRQQEVLKHIRASKDEPMKNNLQSIFSGQGDLIPNFTTSIAYANCLCPLTLGKVWEGSEQRITEILRRRRLDPVWLLHPFA